MKVLLNRAGQMYLHIDSSNLKDKQNKLVGVQGEGVAIFFLTDAERELQFPSEAEIDPAFAARAILKIGTKSKISPEARESLEWIGA